ncbi:Erj5 [Kluyveromyces lactis]|nr:Erj5 [Kluyveromyces lactis]
MLSSSRPVTYALLLSLLAAVAYCFTRDEIEIFQLQQELHTKYGSDMDFYQFLKLPKLKQSTSVEITKNFKKLAKKYHPDKNPKYRKLYERINLITKLLTDEGHRKTYDYYLKNGFPKYDYKKGGFFFNRVAPSVWFTFFFLYVLAGVIHLVLLKLHNNANKKRIENFVAKVREQDTTNSLGESKLVFKESEDSEGKQLLVRFGEVFVIQPDESLVKISTDDIIDPGINDTLLVKLPKWIWNKTLGKFINIGTSKSQQPNKGSANKKKRNSKVNSKVQ